jgi:hypothetical protein
MKGEMTYEQYKEKYPAGLLGLCSDCSDETPEQAASRLISERANRQLNVEADVGTRNIGAILFLFSLLWGAAAVVNHSDTGLLGIDLGMAVFMGVAGGGLLGFYAGRRGDR